MKQESFYLLSEQPDLLKIHVRKFNLEKQSSPNAVMLLVHGMAEHSARYTMLAESLVKKGIIVYAYDQRGHGYSGSPIKGQVLYAQKNGGAAVLKDLNQIGEYASKENPGIPVILFGHSMGSYLARNALFLNESFFSAVILSGTGPARGLLAHIGILLAKILSVLSKNKKPSKLLNRLIHAGFNAKCKPRRTGYDWLSRDPSEVDKYIADPLCGQVVTAGFWRDFLPLIESANDRTALRNFGNKALPILIINGEMDPAVMYKAGGERVCQLLKQSGFEDVTLKIYDGARHELLNEKNKLEVIEDILQFLDAKVLVNISARGVF